MNVSTKEVSKKNTKTSVYINIYRQIAETFTNILQFHENHNRILRNDGERGHAEIIDCIVQLGRSVEETVSLWFFFILYRDVLKQPYIELNP